MDETREVLFQQKIRKEHGEYSDDEMSEAKIWESVRVKARIIRYFYASLVSEGFSEEEALEIVTRMPI